MGKKKKARGFQVFLILKQDIEGGQENRAQALHCPPFAE